MGIYNNLYSITPDILPFQSVTLQTKLETSDDPSIKSWSEKTLDALETIALRHYNDNLSLIENYEMIKGKFIFNHYFENSGNDNMLSQLMAEFELPNYLRHYDIISPVVNTMSGEWQARPDIFNVRQIGDKGANEFLRSKTELLGKYLSDKINSEINKKMVEMGVDPFIEEFESEEQEQQYTEQITQIKQQLTPPEIENYMTYDYLSSAEVWAQAQKEYDRHYFSIPEMEKTEFEDMLVADRCFRHFYVTPQGYKQETWNPINVFYHKNPDTHYIEEGDYVGRIFKLTLPTIIDRYGHYMSKDDFELVSGLCNKKDKNKKWNDSKYDWIYENYMFPFKDYPNYDLLKNMHSVPELDHKEFHNLFNGKAYDDQSGYYTVTEAYWKTQKKLFKVTYHDLELDQPVVKIVDETWVIPKGFKESKNAYDEDHALNTYVSTYVNEVWKGIKINITNQFNLKKDLYLGVGPNDYQFKGDLNFYGCRLPVCGQIFSVRNSKSMSLVDMMKPYQIAYNVCMNQIYQLMEKEIGAFVVFDVNLFPDNKDWGGQDSWNKWMMIAKSFGLVPADTSPNNVNGSLSAVGGFLPKVIDLNLAAQMVSRVELAKFFEAQALKQVGFNDYRVGTYSSQSTAEGIKQGAAQSYSQTETYFTNFSNYLRRCLQMSLDIAQHVQSTNEEILISYIKNDLSRAFVKIMGSELEFSELGVLISNSQEHLRQLEMIRQYGLENNTAGMSPVDVINMITSKSPSEIKKLVEQGYNKFLEQQQQSQEAQNQIEQQKLQLAEQIAATENQQFYDKLTNDFDIAYLQETGRVLNKEEQIPEMPEDTSVQQNNQAINNYNTQITKQRDLDLKEISEANKLNLAQRKLDLEEYKINTQMAIQNKETESVKILKSKDNKKK